MTQDRSPEALAALKPLIREWGRQLGFSAVGFAPIELGTAEWELMDWLDQGFHGDMDYMARHGATRARPAELVPGTASVISARLDYLPDAAEAWKNLDDPERAYVSRYALGRDYHKLMRARLQKLAERIADAIGPFQARPFSDSAPVLEVALASRASLGWRGKHTLLLDRQGSWFFLGELFTDLPFPPDAADAPHCGRCRACIDVCPTAAIIAPYQVDARRCISYLTIEHAGSIPVELRPLLGNRIYGCDDCLAVCPWNKFARSGAMMKPHVRADLAIPDLLELLALDDTTFKARFAGTPMIRTKRRGILRNVCVALGNAGDERALPALQGALRDHEPLIREHAAWAIEQIGARIKDP